MLHMYDRQWQWTRENRATQQMDAGGWVSQLLEPSWKCKLLEGGGDMAAGNWIVDIASTQPTFFCPFRHPDRRCGIWLLTVTWKLSIAADNQIDQFQKCPPQNGSLLILVRGNSFLMRKLSSFSSELVWNWTTVQTWKTDILPAQGCLALAQCQPTQLWRWFCLGSVTIWQGEGCFGFINFIQHWRLTTISALLHSVSLWYLGDETDNHHK